MLIVSIEKKIAFNLQRLFGGPETVKFNDMLY